MGLALCGLSMTAYAQAPSGTHQVRGVIVGNEQSLPLAFASVSLYRQADTLAIAGDRTAENGRFQLSLTPPGPGPYLLKISYLGYETLDTLFSFPSGGTAVNFDTLTLQSTAHTLSSVEVTADRPAMQEHGDTITFNPTAYKTEEDATAEELIQKIPALITDQNGNIQSQGKPITRILVDGKPFLEGNAQDALKMIPATILDKIEVMNDPDQEYNASDPEKPRVLNLVIKKDKKKGYYLNGFASGSDRGQADGRLRGNLFKGEKMGVVRLEGNKGVEDSYNYHLRPFYRDYVNPKFSYRIGMNYNSSNHEGYGNSRKQNFFADTSYFVNQSNANSGDSKGYGLNGGFEYNPDSTLRIRFRQSFDQNESHSASYNEYTYTDQADALLTEGNRRNSSERKSPGMNSNLNLLYRFRKPGRRVETDLSYGRHKSHGVTNVYALRHELKTASTDTTDQQKVQETDNKGLHFRINYMSPFLSDHSQLNLGYNVGLDNNLNDYSSFDLSRGGRVFDSLLSNQYRNHNYNHNLSADYAIHIKQFRYRLGVAYQYILTKGVNFLADSTYRTTRFSLTPRAGVRYEFDEHNKLSFDYNGSLRPPTFEQLQPTVNNTDPQHIFMGNPNLRPEFSSRFQLRFNRYSTSTMNSLNLRTYYNLARNQIQSINTFDTATGVITTQPQNVPANYQLGGNLDYTFFLNKKSSVNLHGHTDYSSFIQRYNQTDYTSSINANTGNITIQQEMDGNLRASGGVKYYINIKEVLFLSGGADLNYATFTSGVTIKGGLEPPVGQQYYNMHSDFDAEVELPWEIKYGFYVNYDKQSSSYNRSLDGYNLVVINSAITKRLFKKKGLLSLRVNDLTNSIAKRNLVIDPDFVKSSPFADKTRFYTLSFSYTVNKLGGRGGGGRSFRGRDRDRDDD